MIVARSDSSSTDVPETPTGRAPAPDSTSTLTSSIGSSAALRTISLVGSVTLHSIRTLPVNVDVEVRGEWHLVADRAQGRRQTPSGLVGRTETSARLLRSSWNRITCPHPEH